MSRSFYIADEFVYSTGFSVIYESWGRQSTACLHLNKFAGYPVKKLPVDWQYYLD